MHGWRDVWTVALGGAEYLLAGLLSFAIVAAVLGLLYLLVVLMPATVIQKLRRK